MSTERISYVPDGRGRFVRHTYAPATSSNRFVEIGRLFYNLIHGTMQLFNVLQYSISTFNNILQSLPFCIRYIVHIILAFFFPFYTIYQGYMILFNRIHRIIYPFYRATILFINVLILIITLPIRIITYIMAQTQIFLKNLLITLLFAGAIIGLIVLFLDEYQLNYMKSYIQNTTDIILKRSSIV